MPPHPPNFFRLPIPCESMKFIDTILTGAYLLAQEPISDERGFFARSYCSKEFQEYGLPSQMVQGNMAFNLRAGTLRGLHYQIPPSREAKLVRCTMGAIRDVIVDLRPESPTYLQHFSVDLTAENRLAIYVPPYFAHGYQTLVDNTEVSYLVSDFHTPECERGLRYDDPALGIEWPFPPSLISARDRAWPLLEAAVTPS